MACRTLHGLAPAYSRIVSLHFYIWLLSSSHSHFCPASWREHICPYVRTLALSFFCFHPSNVTSSKKSSLIPPAKSGALKANAYHTALFSSKQSIVSKVISLLMIFVRLSHPIPPPYESVLFIAISPTLGQIHVIYSRYILLSVPSKEYTLITDWWKLWTHLLQMHSLTKKKKKLHIIL